MNIWENKTLLISLETMRDEKRKREGMNLTFDCFNARYLENDVFCRAGHKLSRASNGCLTLIAVLRGRTALVCRNCPDYKGEEDEGTVSTPES